MSRRTIPEDVKASFLKRLTENVNTSDPAECWEWQGQLNAYDYGRYDGYLTHRIAYEALVGQIGSLFVLHHCDNPPCCNPAHLFLGTQQDNLRDARSKGRLDVRGEKHPRAKLTQAEVDALRREYAKGNVYQYVLAERYGISRGSVSLILRRLGWKHG